MAVVCARIDRMKEAYVDGLLGADARAEIDAHTATCAICSTRLRLARSVAAGMGRAVKASVAGAALSPQRASAMRERLTLAASRGSVRGVPNQRWVTVGAPLLALTFLIVLVIVAWQLRSFEERPAVTPEPSIVSVPTQVPEATSQALVATSTPISTATATRPSRPEIVLPPVETRIVALPTRSPQPARTVLSTLQPRLTQTPGPTRTRGATVATSTRTRGPEATSTRARPTFTRIPLPTRTPLPTWTPRTIPTRTLWPTRTPSPTQQRLTPTPFPTWTPVSTPTQELTATPIMPTETPVPTQVPPSTPEPTEETAPTREPVRTPTSPPPTATETPIRDHEPTPPRPTRTRPPTWTPHVTRTPFPTRTRPPDQPTPTWPRP
jgi:hypothetical protein